MPTAIQVEGIAKRYRIGLLEERPDTIMATLVSWLASPAANFRRLRQLSAFGDDESGPDIVWALRDISFQVEQGEVLGIIGHNGAGKSTLLKVLARITEPTHGRAVLAGRVASLLEVGTGFHPELTGRENVFLNGTLLGMTKREVDDKFDEIVAFAEVERFIDTPVKRYSSGMRVRLAFAVAANLEPEILLIDEVLAVGDAAFQRRCLGKMQDVANEGRTVLFVSHNLGSIRQLCDRCLLLDGGRLVADGPSGEIIEQYVSIGESENEAVVVPGEGSLRTGTGEGQVVRVEVLDERGQPSSTLGIAEPFSVRFAIDFPAGSKRLVAGVEVRRSDGTLLLNCRSDGQGVPLAVAPSSEPHTVEIALPGLPIVPGGYRLEPWFAVQGGRRIDHLHDGPMVVLESRGRMAAEGLMQPGRELLLADCSFRATSGAG